MDANGNFQRSVTGKIELVWSNKPKPLTDLLEESTLPIVVKVYTDKLPEESESNGSFDIYQPLLVYKEVVGKKLCAKNVPDDVLVSARESARYNDDGHTIVIPTSYTGWFRLADDEDQPLTTIANVARIMPVRFLSSKFVSGFVAIKVKGKHSDYIHQKVEIQPGVFHVKDMFEDFIRFNQKNVTKRKLMRCLRCNLDDDTEVLLPFESEGCFYLIEIRTSVSKHANIDDIGFVYNISDMITAGLTKDVTIQLIHGRPPKKQCGFTSRVKVYDMIKDRTIVGCTLNKEKRLLELPLTPYPLFVKALNDTDALISNPLYAQIVMYMEMVADDYANELKVRYNYSVSDEVEKERKEKTGLKEESIPEDEEKEEKKEEEEETKNNSDDDDDSDVFRSQEEEELNLSDADEETTKL